METNYQKPVFNIPEKGQVGEITVPFCDTKRDPYVYAERGYRVLLRQHALGEKSHCDTRMKKASGMRSMILISRNRFMSPSHDMRLVPNDELTLLSPDVPDEEKHILVDLSTQLVTAFEGEKMVFSQRCSSGVKGTDTPKGDFRTYHKGPSVHMTNQGDAVENEHL